VADTHACVGHDITDIHNAIQMWHLYEHHILSCVQQSPYHIGLAKYLIEITDVTKLLCALVYFHTSHVCTPAFV
jgi:hypothetical protein